MLLENKIAVITGGGRGIGRSIAMLFAENGAKIALIARTTKQIENVAKELRQVGCECIAITADISDENKIYSSVEGIHNHFGKIDVLVNNAGIEYKNPFVEMSMDEWDQTMNVNARGIVICTKAVLPFMIRQKEGSIINISSGAGLRGLPGSSAYGASKAAVISLSFSLADEFQAHGIRVNVICPGLIKTDMLYGEAKEGKKTKVLHPDNVAGTAVFIASELSGNISGQVFSVRNSNRW